MNKQGDIMTHNKRYVLNYIDHSILTIMAMSIMGGYFNFIVSRIFDLPIVFAIITLLYTTIGIVISYIKTSTLKIINIIKYLLIADIISVVPELYGLYHKEYDIIMIKLFILGYMLQLTYSILIKRITVINGELLEPRYHDKVLDIIWKRTSMYGIATVTASISIMYFTESYIIPRIIQFLLDTYLVIITMRLYDSVENIIQTHNIKSK
jgi:hypothetical protein